VAGRAVRAFGLLLPHGGGGEVAGEGLSVGSDRFGG
jgi:hypothetical protein